MQNVGPCQELFQASANDVDPSDFGKLAYSIFSGNSGNMFSIDQSTGVISMACNGSTGLDRETQDSHSMTVRVEDSVGHQVDKFASSLFKK